MEADERFHNLIVELSDNPYDASFSASLQIRVVSIRASKSNNIITNVTKDEPLSEDSSSSFVTISKP